MIELMRKLLCLPEQASSLSREIDLLHFLVIGTTLAGATAVALVAIYFIVRYRYRKTRSFRTERIEAPAWLELSVAGGMLGLFLLFWQIGFTQYVKLTYPPRDAMTVYVTGKQWMWQFAYPEGPSSLPQLYVPANRPVKLYITSRDVIHSFFVPAFRVKQDAVPGRYTIAWFEATTPGRYELLCAEFCGSEHSRMRGEVVVLRPDDYEAWIKGKLAARARTDEPDLAARGRSVAAAKGCLQCHEIDVSRPPGGAAYVGPSWVGLYGRRELLSDGSTVLADEAYLTESMYDPNARIVAGFPPIMPSYRGNLEPAETAAIVELIRSLGTRGAVSPGNARASLQEPNR